MQSLAQPVVEVISHQDDKGHSILLVDFNLQDLKFVEYYLSMMLLKLDKSLHQSAKTILIKHQTHTSPKQLMIGLIGFNLHAKKESAPFLQQQTNDTSHVISLFHLGTLRGPFTPRRPQQYFPSSKIQLGQFMLVVSTLSWFKVMVCYGSGFL